MSTIRDIISELYGIAKEGEESVNDGLRKNYCSGYRDALMTVDIILKNITEDEEVKKKPVMVQEEAPPAAEEKTAPEKKIYEKVCKDCGKEFRTTVGQKRFCPECAAKRKKESTLESNKRNKEQDKKRKIETADKTAEHKCSVKAAEPEESTVKEKQIKTCEMCGRKFRANVPQRRFCDECAEKRRKASEAKYRKAHPKKRKTKEVGPWARECKDCGKIFLTMQKNRHLCDECQKIRTKENKQKPQEKQRALLTADSTYIQREDRAKQEKINNALNEAARIQKETGKSYGQQMAEKFLKGL